MYVIIEKINDLCQLVDREETESMRITGFCPLIVTKDPESVVKLFEDMGFSRRHTKKDIEGGANTTCAMKDAYGNRINITSSETVPKDMTSITVNVDDFREAYDFLIAHGFTDPRGNKVTETSSSIATMLVSPSGFPVTISEHVKALRYQDQLGDLKDDPRTKKQLKVMMDVTAAAFRNNMASYIKLVQMDVLKEFNRMCDEEGIGGERVRFCHGMMDPLLAQINRDLYEKISAEFELAKEQLTE